MKILITLLFIFNALQASQNIVYDYIKTRCKDCREIDYVSHNEQIYIYKIEDVHGKTRIMRIVTDGEKTIIINDKEIVNLANKEK